MEVLVNVPCVIFEDDHLLAVNKPAGMNTHAPDPYAGEGIYDWLRHREPRWARLAIIHRLDKETSGVLVFSKTELANRSLTEQFTRGAVKKNYLLLTDRPVRRKEFTVTSALIRAGGKYLMRPAHAGGARGVRPRRGGALGNKGHARLRRGHGELPWRDPRARRERRARAHEAVRGSAARFRRGRRNPRSAAAGQASIEICPGSAATRSSQARTAGYGSSSKPPSGATCVYA